MTRSIFQFYRIYIFYPDLDLQVFPFHIGDILDFEANKFFFVKETINPLFRSTEYFHYFVSLNWRLWPYDLMEWLRFKLFVFFLFSALGAEILYLGPGLVLSDFVSDAHDRVGLFAIRIIALIVHVNISL